MLCLSHNPVGQISFPVMQMFLIRMRHKLNLVLLSLGRQIFSQFRLMSLTLHCVWLIAIKLSLIDLRLLFGLSKQFDLQILAGITRIASHDEIHSQLGFIHSFIFKSP